jgi:transaldolase
VSSTDDRLARLLELGQSPWLDNLRRGWITSGELQRWVDRGIRGLTSNPSIFQKAISTGSDYDDQFGRLVAEGVGVDAVYWELVVEDIRGALDVLRPVHDASDGLDGYVSVEVAPDLARDSAGTEAAARELHERIAAPNLYVKIPGTAEGLAPIQAMIAEGRSINVTLIFSLERYAEVMEAYLAGLE